MFEVSIHQVALRKGKLRQDTPKAVGGIYNQALGFIRSLAAFLGGCLRCIPEDFPGRKMYEGA